MKELNDPGIDGLCSCTINISCPIDKEKIRPCTFMKECGISVTKRRMVRCQCPAGSSSLFGKGLIFDEGLSPDECTEIWDTLELKKCGRYQEQLNLIQLVYRDFNEFRK
jgi:hypothetical protein